MSEPVAIALGANIGPREQSLVHALELLDEFKALTILSISSLYESPPWGDPDQPDFLNAVMVGDLEGPVEELFAHLKASEQRVGKRTVRRWGPRVIDLDLLAVGERVSKGQELELPHPRMAGRPFVYLPLREACDGLSLPPSWDRHRDANDEGRALEGVTRQRFAEGLFPSRPLGRELELHLAGVEETEALGRAIGAGCRAGEVLALSGPLGAGKSVLVRAMARSFGIEGPLPSPTYTLCREYRTGRLSLQHWDFYRMESLDDLESSGFPPERGEFDVLAVEWAEKFPDALRDGRVTHLSLEPVAGATEQRRARIQFGAGSLRMRIAVQGEFSC